MADLLVGQRDLQVFVADLPVIEAELRVGQNGMRSCVAGLRACEVDVPIVLQYWRDCGVHVDHVVSSSLPDPLCSHASYDVLKLAKNGGEERRWLGIWLKDSSFILQARTRGVSVTLALRHQSCLNIATAYRLSNSSKTCFAAMTIHAVKLTIAENQKHVFRPREGFSARLCACIAIGGVYKDPFWHYLLLTRTNPQHYATFHVGVTDKLSEVGMQQKRGAEEDKVPERVRTHVLQRYGRF